MPSPPQGRICLTLLFMNFLPRLRSRRENPTRPVSETTSAAGRPAIPSAARTSSDLARLLAAEAKRARRQAHYTPAASRPHDSI